MIVELAGLPGVGKSTIAKALTKNGWEVIQADSRSELLWYNLLFVLNHPIRFFLLLGYIFSHANSFSEWYLLFMNSFLHVNAKYIKAKKHEKAIIDQGYTQNIVSFFTKPADTRAINQYLNTVLKPDLVIFLTAPQEIRKKRLRQRGYGIRDRSGNISTEQWLQAADENISTARECLQESTWQWEIITTTGGEREVVRSVQKRINDKPSL